MKDVCAAGLGSETPMMAIDHNPDTKFLDFNHGQVCHRSVPRATRPLSAAARAAWGQLPRSGSRARSVALQRDANEAIAASNLMVWFRQPTHITSYTFWTANDAPERDPSSWEMQGCVQPCNPNTDPSCTDGCIRSQVGGAAASGWVVLDRRSAYAASSEDDLSNQDEGAVNQDAVSQPSNLADVTPGRLAPQRHFRVGCEFEGAASVGHSTTAGQIEDANRMFVAFPSQQTYDASRTYCMRHLDG
eukprot:SAG11_NODE_7211_length_1177_cov_1.392393_2_plen_245_part_01